MECQQFGDASVFVESGGVWFAGIGDSIADRMSVLAAVLARRIRSWECERMIFWREKHSRKHSVSQ